MTILEKRDDPFFNLIEILLARKLRLIIGFLSIFVIVVYGVIKMPAMYEAKTKVYIAPPYLPRIQAPYLDDFGRRSFLGNEVEVIKSRAVLMGVVRKFQGDGDETTAPSIPPDPWTRFVDYVRNILGIKKKKLDPIEAFIDYMKFATSVRLAQGTNVVTIATISGSAEWSALLTNSIAESYINYANELIYNKTDSAYSYIEKQVENARQKFDESEKVLNEFKSRKNVYSLANESVSITNKLAQYENEYQQIKLKIENPDKQIDSLELQTLSNQLMELKNRLAQLLIYHTVEHPDVKALHNRIAKIETILIKAKSINENKKSEISESEIKELKLKKNYLSKQINDLLKRRNELAKIQEELNKKTKEYLDNQQNLNMLMATLKRSDILKTREMEHGTIRILDRAVPPSFPSTKRKKILFAIGTLFGITFSIGMAFIAEYLDDSLKTPNEAEKYLNCPVLGSVPKITRKLKRI